MGDAVPQAGVLDGIKRRRAFISVPTADASCSARHALPAMMDWTLKLETKANPSPACFCQIFCHTKEDCRLRPRRKGLSVGYTQRLVEEAPEVQIQRVQRCV